MPSQMTDVSRDRLTFLLESPWPTSLGDVHGWLADAPIGRHLNPPDGSGVTPVTFTTHEGQISSFHWFAPYPDSTQLVEAHSNLGDLISGLLGITGLQERDGDPSGYWQTARFAIETYAHGVAVREDGRQLIPTLQVSVADAAVSAAKEALARQSANPPSR